MRRWLAIVLLALLPIQFSWAALASYCGHENGQPARHLGHAQHAHDAHDALDSDAGAVERSAGPGATPQTPSGFDFDCGYCHATLASLPALAAGVGLPLAAAPSWVPLTEACRTRAQSPPDRPQWLRLA